MRFHIVLVMLLSCCLYAQSLVPAPRVTVVLLQIEIVMILLFVGAVWQQSAVRTANYVAICNDSMGSVSGNTSV